MPAKKNRTASPIARTLALALALNTLWLLAAAAIADRVRLPQDYDYQVVLRNYLSTLDAAAFEIELKPLTFDPAWVETDEQLHRLWLVAGYDRRLGPVPELSGLTIAADNFTLDSIEGETHIMMRAGHRGGQRLRDEPRFSIQPADTVWWALWNYPGNPYQGSQAVRNRAFAVCAVDMIMLDHLHESGTHWVDNARRSDFLGGTMIWLTYVYHAVKDDLPAEVRQAYETGLAKFMARLTEWGPTRVNDNMDMKANVAMVYLAQAVDDPAIREQARAYVRRNLGLVHAAGNIRDAGGLDASYSGIALVNIVWAAVASQWPELIETVQRMSDLKAHLSFPEPDGSEVFGPSHFSTRTGHGHPNDQWSRPYRDIAAAMIADQAIYLMFGGRRGRQGNWGAPDRDTMLAQVARGIDHIGEHLKPSPARFTRWLAGWWPGTINYAHDDYRPGFYDRLRDLRETDDPLALLPVTRPEARFIRIFPDPDWSGVSDRDRDTFLVARLGGYAAAAYTGPIGNTRYMNFAGGALSVFWTPEAGSVILGRTGHPVHPASSRQTWDDWRLWPTHALSGQTEDGKAFSSARIRRRVADVRYETMPDGAARVDFAGPIGARHDGGRSTQDGAIEGEVGYRRHMVFNDEGVEIETAIEADGSDRVAELYEILPLLLDEPRRQRDVHQAVFFHVGGERLPAGTEPVAEVVAVEVQRLGGGALIEFNEPRIIRLSPDVWEDTYQTRIRMRNLLIDLLPPEREDNRLHSASLRYRIRPLPASGTNGGIEPELFTPRE